MDIKDTIEKVFSYDKISNRYFELLKRGLPLADVEAICYHMIDKQVRSGDMRTNRPDPTVSAEPTYKEKQDLECVRAMNISDTDWIARLNQYKKDIEVGLIDDSIKLTAEQKEWVAFLERKSTVPPVRKIPVKIEKDTDVVEASEIENDLPF